MYLLLALSAGLVRCLYINRFYKLSEGVWREFCEVGVSVCPLNKLFKVFYLSFLYFDFFLQIYDFNFELRLLILVGLAHHGKAVIVQLALGVVLVDFDKQAVKLPYTLFCLRQTLLYTLMVSSLCRRSFCSISTLKCASYRVTYEITSFMCFQTTSSSTTARM